ncbi:MAG: shikimate kinase [Lachnospiraceae bacterium]|nr:shikimate kinase [Lachnospiraceae bacterium]
MNNIYLIGFMGCGKTSSGKKLSKLLNIPFLDTDQMIVETAGKKIPDIFNEEGEEAFRARETEVFRRLAEEKTCGAVISCGGGAALREENVTLMKQGGIVVMLTAKPETIYHRVKGGHNRPLLEGRMNVEGIAELMEGRLPFYEKAADVKIKTDRLRCAQVAKNIQKAIKAMES